MEQIGNRHIEIVAGADIARTPAYLHTKTNIYTHTHSHMYGVIILIH